jgi:hypothetical protein
MAELKPLGRAVAQPSAPDISAAGQAYGTIGKLIQGAAKTVGEYKKREKEAALEMESTFNTLTAQREMNLNLLKLKQKPNLTDQDLEELNLTNQEIGKNILKNTSPENRNAVTKSLMQSAIKSEASAFEIIASSKKKQIKQSAALTFFEGSKQLEEQVLGGDNESADITFNQIEKSQRDMMELGYLSPEQYQRNRDDLLQTAINGRLQYEYTQALEQGGERAGAKFIENFWETEHENLTQAQKNVALKGLISLRSQDRAASNQVGQAGFRDVMEYITSGNPPKSENDVLNFIAAQEEKGFGLNEYQEYKAIQAFRKTQKTSNRRNEKNIEISGYVATQNINALLNESSTDIDNNYIDTKKFIVEQMAQESQEQPNLSGQVMANRPDWMIGATIAAQTPVPIGQWQSEIHSQLLSSSPQDILGAVSAYNYVSKQNKIALDGVSAKDKAFISAVTNDLERTTLTPQEVIEKYKDAILNVDPRVAENRELAYKQIIKDNPGLPNNIVKKAFGDKIKNTLLQPSAELYATAQESFEREYKLTGDENQAIKNAVSYLKDNGGVSLFGPKGQPVWNPPENLPYNDFGNIVRNQATKYLKETVINASENPGKLPYKVEWSSKMPQFPDKVSEQDLFKNKYDKGEWWLKINDVDRRVYFISPNYNQANSFAETRYQVMYEKDDGYLHELLTVNPSLVNGEISMAAGSSMMTFKGPLELTPNLVSHMQKERATGAKERYFENEYKRQNPDFNAINAAEGADISQFLYGNPEEKKFTQKKEKEQLRRIVEEKNKNLPKEIEKEKFRRQQEATKQSTKVIGGLE